MTTETQDVPIEAPPQTLQPSEIPLSSNLTIKKRTCEKCVTEFPLDGRHFYADTRGYFKKMCHECDYKTKIENGKTPKFPAKNGILQKDYHAQLKMQGTAPRSSTAASSKPKTGSWDAPADSPWLKGGKSEPTSPPPASSAAKPGKMLRRFDIDPKVQKTRDGTYILTINDYFSNQGKYKTVPAEQDRRPDYPTSKGPENPRLARAETIDGDPEDYERDGGPPPDFDEDIDYRAELLKSVVTYPDTANRFGLSIEKVQDMSDEDCARWFNTFSSVNCILDNGQYLHLGLVVAADAITYFTKDTEINETFTVDLTGWSEDLAKDPMVASLINQIVAQYEEECEEYLIPEYKLAALVAARAHQNLMANNHKRLERISKYAKRYGPAGFTTTHDPNLEEIAPAGDPR